MRMLYVGRDRDNPSEFCPGSTLCMSIVEKLHTEIQVQDCTVLRQKKTLPEWLNGTPIFVDQTTNSGPLRGKDAVRALRAILNNEALQQPPDNEDEEAVRYVQPPPRGGGVAGAVPRMQPAATRQPSTRPRAPNAVHRSSDEPPQTSTDGIAPLGEDNLDELPPDTMANGTITNAVIRDDKVTDEDLQAFMEARKQSPASATPQQPQM